MKTDARLGYQVHKHLVGLKIESPGPWSTLKDDEKFTLDSVMARPEKYPEGFDQIFARMLEFLGLPLNDESLSGTPDRIAKMMWSELFIGLDYKNFPKIQISPIHMDTGMVVQRDIAVKSICEHHWMPIDGTATIAYIPKTEVIGLSKLNRITDFFCRRPQLQERIGQQILQTLKFLLNTKDVAVLVKSKHFCVSHRGKQDINSEMVTSALSGDFLYDSAVRNEFFHLSKI